MEREREREPKPNQKKILCVSTTGVIVIISISHWKNGTHMYQQAINHAARAFIPFGYEKEFSEHIHMPAHGRLWRRRRKKKKRVRRGRGEGAGVQCAVPLFRDEEAKASARAVFEADTFGLVAENAFNVVASVQLVIEAIRHCHRARGITILYTERERGPERYSHSYICTR